MASFIANRQMKMKVIQILQSRDIFQLCLTHKLVRMDKTSSRSQSKDWLIKMRTRPLLAPLWLHLKPLAPMFVISQVARQTAYSRVSTWLLTNFNQPRSTVHTGTVSQFSDKTCARGKTKLIFVMCFSKFVDGVVLDLPMAKLFEIKWSV